jgi:thymidylate synthase
MAIVHDRYVVGTDLSIAWLDAVRCVNAMPCRKAVHLLVRVLDPTVETQVVRDAADALIDGRNARSGATQMPQIDTTRNTIFPAAWAELNPEPEDLAEYYRSLYTRESLRGFRANARGTYFGRIVAYPRADGSAADQLTDTVRKLRNELAVQGPKSSRYEINIFSEARDTNPMGFPCLAHLSLHLHDHRLHLQAVYRNEKLVARGYGNYLGLAELLRYIASAVDIEVGELLVTAGHAELDAPKTVVRAMLSAVDEEIGEPAGPFDHPGE